MSDQDKITRANPAESQILSALAPENVAGQRLDKWLAQDAFPQLSRAHCQELIRQGHLLVNGERETRPSAGLLPGANYALTLPTPAAAIPQPENIPLDILFDDAYIAVISKPAGLTCHPAPGNPDGTLVNALLFHFSESLSGIGGVARPGIVHRLDKDTSGVMVIAKQDKAHRILSDMFARHDLSRKYLALLRGAPKENSGYVEANIGRSPYDRKKMSVVLASKGKTAVTDYKILEKFGRIHGGSIAQNAASLVKCELQTGRTHQIRVHMAHLGHAVIGDPLYAPNRKLKLAGNSAHILAAQNALDVFPRQALHAYHLAFCHPISGEELSFTEKPPDDFSKLLLALRALT